MNDYTLEAVRFVPNQDRGSHRLGRADILIRPLGLVVEKMSVVYSADAVRVAFPRCPVLNGREVAIRDDRPVFIRYENFPDRADYLKFSERALRAIEHGFPGALAEVIDSKSFSDLPPFSAGGAVRVSTYERARA